MKSVKKIKIGLTGSGTGGHFYPLIAVAEMLRELEPEAELLFFAPNKYNEQEINRLNVRYVHVAAGKRRNYFSFLNFVDIFKIAFGLIEALAKLLFHYPDVIFSKGGYTAFPVLQAARWLRIPIVIHESDIVPGRVSQLSEKFARRVAISWPQAIQYITNSRTAVVGTPIRRSLLQQDPAGGRELLQIPPEARVILILGGSQGAQVINQAVVEALPVLLKDFYVIHQSGVDHAQAIEAVVKNLLSNTDFAKRYQLFGSLDTAGIARALGAADVVITRAGASSLFEIAAVGQVPGIVIPISSSINDHQRKNAYAFAEAGAGIVIEENNLTPELLSHEVRQLLSDQERYQNMKLAARKFSPPDAAVKIANEILEISHEHQ